MAKVENGSIMYDRMRVSKDIALSYFLTSL